MTLHRQKINWSVLSIIIAIKQSVLESIIRNRIKQLEKSEANLDWSRITQTLKVQFKEYNNCKTIRIGQRNGQHPSITADKRKEMHKLSRCTWERTIFFTSEMNLNLSFSFSKMWLKTWYVEAVNLISFKERSSFSEVENLKIIAMQSITFHFNRHIIF